MQNYAEIRRDKQRDADIRRTVQSYAEIRRDTQTYAEVRRHVQTCADIRSDTCQMEAQICTDRHRHTKIHRDRDVEVHTYSQRGISIDTHIETTHILCVLELVFPTRVKRL